MKGKISARRWRRLLWGVEFSNSDYHAGLIGTAWDKYQYQAVLYAGEPTRALLFTTRLAAREWCRAKRATYADRTDTLRFWRFRAVRVRESITPLK